MAKSTILVALVLSALLICTGCSNGRTLEPTTLSPSATAIAAVVEADTATPRPSPAVTPSIAPMETDTATATVTSTTSPSPLPPPTVTPTAFPTLSSEMAETFLADFLLHGSGCPLPCWWGAIPSQTSWVSIEPFLRSLDVEVNRLGTAYFPPSLVGYEVTIAVSEDISTSRQIYVGYLVNDGIVETITIGPGRVPAYSLGNILSRYGSPAEIWLDTTTSVAYGTALPIGLHLYYPQNGFLIQYRDWAELEGEYIVGCFEQDEERSQPLLFLWDPEDTLTFSEALKKGGSETDLFPVFRLPLEEATAYSIDAFHEAFAKSNGPICLETPAELWVGH